MQDKKSRTFISIEMKTSLKTLLQNASEPSRRHKNDLGADNNFEHPTFCDGFREVFPCVPKQGEYKNGEKIMKRLKCQGFA